MRSGRWATRRSRGSSPWTPLRRSSQGRRSPGGPTRSAAAGISSSECNRAATAGHVPGNAVPDLEEASPGELLLTLFHPGGLASRARPCGTLLVAGDEEAPGAVGLDACPPAEVAAAGARVAVRQVAEQLPFVRGELVLLLVVGEGPDVPTAGQGVRQAQDPREDLRSEEHTSELQSRLH